MFVGHRHVFDVSGEMIYRLQSFICSYPRWKITFTDRLNGGKGTSYPLIIHWGEISYRHLINDIQSSWFWSSRVVTLRMELDLLFSEAGF